MKPKQERLVNRPAFRQRRRIKEESLVDLATNLRQMVAHDYPCKNFVSLEEEILDQFITALDTREKRMGVSQSSPTSLDEGLTTNTTRKYSRTEETAEESRCKHGRSWSGEVHRWSQYRGRRYKPANLDQAQLRTTNSPNGKTSGNYIWSAKAIQEESGMFQLWRHFHYKTDCSRNRNENNNSGNASKAGLRHR